jgi:hypothetical protein
MDSLPAAHGGRRWFAVALLLAVAAIHVALVPQHLHEAPYAGALFVALAAGAIATAVGLIVSPLRLAWLSAGALSFGAVCAYVVSRSVGLPSLQDDVGDWLNPLGVAALLTEAATFVVCVAARPQSLAVTGP